MQPNEIISRLENPVYYSYNQLCDFINSIDRDIKIIKTNKKIEYYNIPCAFDIETSSFTIDCEKYSLMYEWTLGINFSILYGRTWEELENALNEISDYFQLGMERRMIIYIHNASFEFQFIKKHFAWNRIFSLKKRKPIQMQTVDGFEFRCSYLLSGYSLAGLGKTLNKYKVAKKEGDLNYDLVRHSYTPLSKKELDYCLYDVLVVMAYIQETIDRLGDITKIPLTKTGYVRKYCRDNCLYESSSHKKRSAKWTAYRKIMQELQIDKDEYVLLNSAFQGGFTHANPYYSRGVFKNVSSYDFTSSYPAVMISEKFPMSKGEFVEIHNYKAFLNNLKYYCCVFEVKFKKLQPIVKCDNYISVSHCTGVKPWIGKPLENNGRVVYAEELCTIITEIDFEIIMNCYKWEEIEIRTFIRYRKDYLPTNFVKAILNLYVDKTTLKGVEGREDDYMRSKEQLNSCFGMCVTDICRDEIVYEDEDWIAEEPDIEVAVSKYNKSLKRFLFYPWGIWVTAYARKNLFTGILEFNMDYIYADTDSIKVTNVEEHLDYFEEYNEMLKYKLEKAMKYHGLSMDMVHPKTIEGKEKLLGEWDYEGKYTRFKTIGAKRYMVEKRNKDGKLEISLTVSGLNKKVAVPYLLKKYGKKKIFEEFNDGLYIPPKYTGKMTHTYIDEEKEGYVTDYLGNTTYFKELSGIHLEDCEYDARLSKKYLDFLNGLIEE